MPTSNAFASLQTLFEHVYQPFCEEHSDNTEIPLYILDMIEKVVNLA